jgi:hypothetical protein
MASLASLADVVRFGYSLPSGEEEALLARASARIRRAAGQQITSTESTVRLPVNCGAVTLPGPPITAVSAVERVAEDGGAAVMGWKWGSGDKVTNVSVWGDVMVTYTHGFPDIPEELVELVCSVAARLGNTPNSGGMEAGIRSEAIDDYTVTFASEALELASGLLPGEETALSRVIGDPPTAYMVRMR